MKSIWATTHFCVVFGPLNVLRFATHFLCALTTTILDLFEQNKLAISHFEISCPRQQISIIYDVDSLVMSLARSLVRFNSGAVEKIGPTDIRTYYATLAHTPLNNK